MVQQQQRNKLKLLLLILKYNFRTKKTNYSNMIHLFKEMIANRGWSTESIYQEFELNIETLHDYDNQF